jgi:hypothetical protein
MRMSGMSLFSRGQRISVRRNKDAPWKRARVKSINSDGSLWVHADGEHPQLIKRGSFRELVRAVHSVPGGRL